MKRILMLCCFSVMFAFPAHAALSSSSNWEDELSEDEIPLINDLEGGEIENDSGILHKILDVVQSIDRNVAPANLATLSDAVPSDQEDDVSDRAGEVNGFVADAVPFASALPDAYVNVLRFDITVDGRSYICLFPPEHIDKLYIDANNRLWNMSTQTVQGRIVDENFDPYALEGTLVYLTPCLGNNFSSIRNYGSPNYLRKYYYSGGRYYYDDTYSEIVVDRYYSPYFVSDFWNYLFLFLIGGGVLILWLRTYKRY